MGNKSSSNSNPTPKDTVILHMIPRGKTIPNLSAFVLKLETFLKMYKIPYEIDTKNSMSPKTGKTPWITINGMNTADSQLIIEHLTSKFGLDVWGSATEEQKAIARTIRIMLEEHFMWGMAKWRITEGINKFPQLIELSSLKFRAMKLILPGRIKRALHAQGIGRHSVETIVKMTGDDLRNVSIVLGNKKFILGDEPCEADCAIFGFLAQCVWGAPGSPYEALVNNELSNLKEYCYRIKERFWPDWDDCLFKK